MFVLFGGLHRNARGLFMGQYLKVFSGSGTYSAGSLELHPFLLYIWPHNYFFLELRNKLSKMEKGEADLSVLPRMDQEKYSTKEAASTNTSTSLVHIPIHHKVLPEF